VPAPRGNQFAKGSKTNGRPSLYKPRYAKVAKELCERGATNADLARFFKVSVFTIRQWRLQYEDFSTAVRVGKRAADDRVEESLYQRAIGYDFDTVKVFRDKNGKPALSEPYIEHIPPDVEACKWWLRNRRPDRWRDKIEVEQRSSMADRSPEEIKRALVQKMVEWKLVPIENVPPELLAPIDDTVDDD
jgi:hypothetical protein